MDASEDHADLFSTIRKYIRPNTFTVIQTGHSSHAGAAADIARTSEPRRPKKGAKKGKKKAPKKVPPPPPPPAPKAEAGEDYEYEYEDSG